MKRSSELGSFEFLVIGHLHNHDPQRGQAYWYVVVVVVVVTVVKVFVLDVVVVLVAKVFVPEVVVVRTV